MLQRDYCQKCKRTNIPLLKHRRTKKYQEYWCRDCNRDRQHLYRLTEKGKKAAANSRDSSNTRFPDKYKARQTLRKALDAREITKPATCDICNSQLKLYAHHPDYYKPLRVIWVCSGCHANIHKVI